MRPRAVIISVGDELLRGERTELNSLFLVRSLFRLGFEVARTVVVGDDREEIAREFERAAETGSLVVLGGGLGPTEDDLTRDAIAEACGVPLREDAEAREKIKRALTARGREFSPNQGRQALFPAGTEILPNDQGTAPGFWGVFRNACFMALPGVPGELRAMWTAYAEEVIRERFSGLVPPRWKVLRLFGLPEAEVQRRITECVGREAARSIGICAYWWVISVYLIDELVEAAGPLRRVLAPHVFGEDDEDLAGVLVAELRKRGAFLGAAESLTGGAIGRRVTSVPGASEVFRGSLVLYAEETKERFGISGEILSRDGAVSETCAAALAETARRRFGAGFGIGVTGFAGPGGGTPENPVGTVFVAAVGPETEIVHRLRVKGGREDVREVTVNYALASVLTLLGRGLVGGVRERRSGGNRRSR